jgi:cyclase
MKTNAPMLRPGAPALLLVLVALLTALPAAAQRDFSQVEIKTQELAPGLYMLQGAGGNLAVLAGEDGTLLIDDDYAPLTEKIKAAIGKISPQPLRFVVNTHWHGDHTGGNENLGKAGVVLVAHDNVRARMSTDQHNKIFDRKTPPAPHAALPLITFAEGVTFEVNGEQVAVFHLPSAHTDGDSVVHFKKANVIHTGDLYFNANYPFIDVDSGGSVDGIIAAGKKILSLANDETKIIPGHGPLSNKAELASYVAMIEKARALVAALVAAGKTKDEAVAAKPTAELDEKWGKGFIKPDTFVTLLYASLKK